VTDSGRPLERADALMEMGRPHLAVPVLERALAANPEDPAALWRLAQALEEAGYLREAVAAAERAVVAAPDEASTHIVLSWTLWQSGRVAAAIEAARTAHELDPWNLDVMAMLTWFFSMVGSDKEAARVARAAIELHPDNPDAWNARCSSAWARGDLKDANRSARRALELDPTAAVLHNNVGWTLALERKFLEALPYFERSVELAPESNGTFNLAFCLRALDRAHEADQVIRIAANAGLGKVEARLAERPTTSRLHLERSHWLVLLDRHVEAFASLEHALETAASPAETYAAQPFFAAEALRLGRRSDAADGARERLRDERIDWFSCGGVALLGWLLDDVEVASEAAETARRLVESPKLTARPAGYEALARAEWSVARKLLELAIRHKSANVTCCEHVGLAVAQRELGNTADAAESYALASWMSPQCLSVLQYRPVFGQPGDG
jgi:tetratricopeptide (TPR) repeat protein